MRTRCIALLALLATLLGVVGVASATPHRSAPRARTAPQARVGAAVKLSQVGATPTTINPGTVLTTTNGTWGNTPTSYAYQWEDCNANGASCTAISGATSASYTVVSADVGDTIEVVVTASNSAGSASQTSIATVLVTASSSGAPVNTAAPVASGSTAEGSALTTTDGTWTNSPTSYGGVWQDCTTSSASSCTNIAGSTVTSPSGTYTTACGDVGSYVRAVVIPTNASGNSIAVSNVIGPITAPSSGCPPVNTAAPVASGSATVGSALTTSYGSWANSPTTYSGVWQDCNSSGSSCTNIAGSTVGNGGYGGYTTTCSDVGQYVRAVVIPTNSSGNGLAVSNLIGPITGSACAGGTTVDDAPDGPATPSGGWTTEFADAFGSPFTAQGGSDNTFYPNRYPPSASASGVSGSCNAEPGYNANEMENFTCAQASENAATGLTLTCTYGAPSNSTATGSAINYNCGAAQSEVSGLPSGDNGFDWTDPYGTNREVVVEMKVQFPPNFDSDPGWWGASYSPAEEIDNFEGFGWGVAGNGAAPNGDSADQNWSQSLITMPTEVGYGQEDEQGSYLGFDPSAATHTYTTVYNGSNVQEYVDGNLINWSYPSIGTTLTPTSHTGEPQPLYISYAMRGGSGTPATGAADPVPTFESGSHSMIVRSVAVYENASAGNAGMQDTSGSLPDIAPGTTVAKGLVSRHRIKLSKREGAKESVVRKRLNSRLGTEALDHIKVGHDLHPRARRTCERHDPKLKADPNKIVPCASSSLATWLWIVIIVGGGLLLVAVVAFLFARVRREP